MMAMSQGVPVSLLGDFGYQDDRAYVVDQGRIVLSGAAAELAGDHGVVATDLGR